MRKSELSNPKNGTEKRKENMNEYSNNLADKIIRADQQENLAQRVTRSIRQEEEFNATPLKQAFDKRLNMNQDALLEIMGEQRELDKADRITLAILSTIYNTHGDRMFVRGKDTIIYRETYADGTEHEEPIDRRPTKMAQKFRQMAKTTAKITNNQAAYMYDTLVEILPRIDSDRREIFEGIVWNMNKGDLETE